MGDGGGQHRTSDAVGLAGGGGVLREITHGSTGTVSSVVRDSDGDLLLLRGRDGSNSTSREGSNGERETHV